MKNTACALAILSALLIPRLANAQSVVIDQMQPTVDVTVGGSAIGGGSEQKLAQTVTVGVGGELVGVFLPIACDSGWLVIDIRTVDGGDPGNVVLRRRWFRASAVQHIGTVFRFFPLGIGLTFAAGDQFAVVLMNHSGECGIFNGPAGDSYGRGEAFFDARPNLPGWVRFFGHNLDLPFMTVMRP